mmetsp:Transcript_1793/g.4585  ORF Transcript_1793/g.4585 Transcript_1793/m.4585 type:complete len:294 (-) Transcript_1793:9-890(-)
MKEFFTRISKRVASGCAAGRVNGALGLATTGRAMAPELIKTRQTLSAIFNSWRMASRSVAPFTEMSSSPRETGRSLKCRCALFQRPTADLELTRDTISLRFARALTLQEKPHCSSNLRSRLTSKQTPAVGSRGPASLVVLQVVSPESLSTLSRDLHLAAAAGVPARASRARSSQARATQAAGRATSSSSANFLCTFAMSPSSGSSTSFMRFPATDARADKTTAAMLATLAPETAASETPATSMGGHFRLMWSRLHDSLFEDPGAGAIPSTDVSYARRTVGGELPKPVGLGQGA